MFSYCLDKKTSLWLSWCLSTSSISLSPISISASSSACTGLNNETKVRNNTIPKTFDANQAQGTKLHFHCRQYDWKLSIGDQNFKACRHQPGNFSHCFELALKERDFILNREKLMLITTRTLVYKQKCQPLL